MASTSPRPEPTDRDVVYATRPEGELAFDIYLPKGATRPVPVLVWIHGGAWQFGSKDKPPTVFVEHGYALASLDFRSTRQAPLPANVQDIKAALRFLRESSERWHLDIDRLALVGASSGGHLAALVGTTPEVAELDEPRAPAPPPARCIVSYFGAANLETILSQSTPHGLGVRVPALDRLLGGQPDERTESARLASPVCHVGSDSPPLLLVHGDQDPQMPINQSHELQGAYLRQQREVVFEVVHGAAHGGREFFEGRPLDVALRFLHRHLAVTASISEHPTNGTTA